MTNYDRALLALLPLPVSEVKAIAQRVGRQQPNHQKRCEALARFLVVQHQGAIASASDASWMPPCFEEYMRQWINEIFGR